MRPQKDGLLIHTASWAGRFVGIVPGPAYVAAKHGVVAMSYSINMEEFQHGIRSTVLCPNEVATPILDLRPTPVSPEERARMIQPEHMADLIVYVAKLAADDLPERGRHQPDLEPRLRALWPGSDRSRT